MKSQKGDRALNGTLKKVLRLYMSEGDRLLTQNQNSGNNTHFECGYTLDKIAQL